MNTDLLRFIDSISRDKSIEKESVFADLEAAMVSAARKAYEEAEEVDVRIDRIQGDITATVDGKPIDMKTLGRIAAQTAKQVMIQRIREDERNSIFEEFSERVGSVITGTVTRYEGVTLIVNLGRAEAILPRSEQIPGEGHQPGERVRAMILDVREEQSRVRIVLTQTHPDYIKRLFELEVPEVGERVIEIRALAREAGYRTKIAVSSIDSKVDAVGACVGVRGSRIRNIVDELGGEKIDIVRWNESSQVLISNSLKPAEVKETFLCFELGRATVIVDEDQLSLAIGKRGQNVRLAARLTGWDIDISTPADYDKNVDAMEKALKSVEGVEDVFLDKLLAMGIIALPDIVEVGADPLVEDLSLERELAERIIEIAGVESKRIADEAEAAKQAAIQAEHDRVKANKLAAESGEAVQDDGSAKAGTGDDVEASSEDTEDTEDTEDGDTVGEVTSDAEGGDEDSTPVDEDSTPVAEASTDADATKDSPATNGGQEHEESATQEPPSAEDVSTTSAAGDGSDEETHAADHAEST